MPVFWPHLNSSVRREEWIGNYEFCQQISAASLPRPALSKNRHIVVVPKCTHVPTQILTATIARLRLGFKLKFTLDLLCLLDEERDGQLPNGQFACSKFWVYCFEGKAHADA